MKNLVSFICIYLILILPGFGIEELNNEKTYYLSDCIKIGLENSPIIKKAKYNVEIAKKNVSISKSDYSPILGAGISYWQGINSDRNYDDGYNKRFAPTIGVYLNQLIYNFGKTSANIDMKKFYKIAAEYAYIDSICEVINDIKLKYFTVLEAKSAVEIEENNLLISQSILDTTKRLYEEHKKEEIDYINAKVYLSSAEMSLTAAQNIYNKAMTDLENALYIGNKQNFKIKGIDTFDYYDAYFSPEFIETPKGKWHEIKNRERQEGLIGKIQNIPFSLEYAQEYANKNNLEIKILVSTLDAMKKSALAVKRQYYPSLTGRVGYEYDSKYVQNTDHTFRNNQLNVAINLNSAVNPLAYNSELEKANYQIKLAENDIELFKQNLFFNVKKSYVDVETAQKQIKNAIDKVFYARENINIAINEYVKGNSNYIELQSARQNYNTAKLNYIYELKNYNISLANLEKITHIHNDDYHEKAIKF